MQENCHIGRTALLPASHQLPFSSVRSLPMENAEAQWLPPLSASGLCSEGCPKAVELRLPLLPDLHAAAADDDDDDPEATSIRRK